MIKVNLLKNKAGGPRDQTQTFNSDESVRFTFEEGSDESSPLIKIIVMLLWVAGLFLWERYNIGQLDEQLNQVKVTNQRLTAQVNTLREEVKKAEQLSKDYEDFKNKMVLVKSLGGLRLREIRAMDHLQNVIPEKAWFTDVEIKDNRLEVQGVAANDQVLDNLLEGIRRHSGFQDVLLAKAVEEKNKNGTLKAFLITSGLVGGEGE